MTVETTCPMCKKSDTFEVDAEAYIEWTTGRKLLQDAFPTLSEDKREQLMTGIDGNCWNNLFQEAEF